MDLPELHSEELSLLRFLEQNSQEVEFHGSTNVSSVDNLVRNDACLASNWHNMTSINGIDKEYCDQVLPQDQNDGFSDTESLTSSASAVPRRRCSTWERRSFIRFFKIKN